MGGDFSEIDAAIEQLRFGDADELINGLAPQERSAAVARLREAGQLAFERAHQLADRIQKLARNDHYAALYVLSNDLICARLLGLLPEKIRRGAEVHLNGARRRREQSLSSARAYIAQARTALDTFRTSDARKALLRVETAWFEEDDRAELSALRERLSLAKAEGDALTTRGEQILGEHNAELLGSRDMRSGCLARAFTLLVFAIAVALMFL